MINWTELRPSFKDCSVCSCVDRLVETGVSLETQLTAAQEREKALRNRLQESSRIVEKYKDACMEWAKESHHKGKTQNRLFWERRAKSMAVLLKDIKQALSGK